MNDSHGTTTICVIGMHRSGTSLLARLLNLAGVELGPAGRLAPAAEDNPRGFWEHEALRGVNEDLLQAFGGSWMDPPVLPADWLRDPRVAPLRARARELLGREFSGARLRGFKDPRTSLLTEFWREVFPGRVVWIVAVRNPLEVCDSLKRRNLLPSVVAEDLWCAYTRAALLATEPQERAIVHYERLLMRPAEELSRALRALGLEEPSEAARTAMREESNGSLRHHLHDMEEVARCETLRPDTRELYRRLWAGEEPAPLHDGGEADDSGFRRAFVGLRGEVARLVDEKDRMKSALGDRERQALEARERYEQISERFDREVQEWRDEALTLRDENHLLKKRTEYRLGERLRRVWRRLRKSRNND